MQQALSIYESITESDPGHEEAQEMVELAKTVLGDAKIYDEKGAGEPSTSLQGTPLISGKSRDAVDEQNRTSDSLSLQEVTASGEGELSNTIGSPGVLTPVSSLVLCRELRRAIADIVCS